jgi:hypothetical protein
MKSVTSFCLATTSLSTSTLPDDSTVVLDVFAVVKSTTDIASDSAVDVVDAVDVVVDDVATVDVDDSDDAADDVEATGLLIVNNDAGADSTEAIISDASTVKSIESCDTDFADAVFTCLLLFPVVAADVIDAADVSIDSFFFAVSDSRPDDDVGGRLDNRLLLPELELDAELDIVAGALEAADAANDMELEDLVDENGTLLPAAALAALDDDVDDNNSDDLLLLPPFFTVDDDDDGANPSNADGPRTATALCGPPPAPTTAPLEFAFTRNLSIFFQIYKFNQNPPY